MDAERADPLLELVDRQQIHELLVRYCRAVDRADGELLLSCYHADAYDDHGTCKGSPADLLAYLRKRTMNPAVIPGPIQHSIGNVLIDLDGDVAYVEAYVESRAVGADGVRSDGLARYVDRVERRDGEWRIAHRRVILEHARPGFDTSDFVPGFRDRRDPSYERSSLSSASQD